MWERVKRLFRSVFGGIIESAEDPELILKQTIRDMQDNVPKMRENVAQVMATEKQLEKQAVVLEREIGELDMKVKAAIKQGRDDIARTYITGLQEKQAALERSRGQLESARTAALQARKFLDNYILQVKKRAAEAQQLVNEARAAKMQEQLSTAMASFQVGDDSSTFDEMREKIQRRSASAEARMDLATGGIESQIADIERESMSLQVEDLLSAYKQQMGVGQSGGPRMDSESEKSLGPSDRAKALE